MQDSSIQSESQVVDLEETQQNSTSIEQSPPSAYDIPASQEKTRARLAMGLLFLLGGSLIGIAIYVAFNRDDATNRELITLIWTSEVTLASSALGFYFGSKGN
ncbi:MAG: hypothetical protein HC856_03865 [Pseudanabaena sp. RU_4_16]|nr:hypothetical protein [Pseudanabaena sp. RU_4_16]NKB18576.1 hypothetical protein [Pseudanabaena sp. CRU_2_10]